MLGPRALEIEAYIQKGKPLLSSDVSCRRNHSNPYGFSTGDCIYHHFKGSLEMHIHGKWMAFLWLNVVYRAC